MIVMHLKTGLCVFIVAGLAAGARLDRWEIIGPGGGGALFNATISPHNPNDVLVSCDMTGAYITHDGGQSWRMFNLGAMVKFFVFDPVDRKTIYAKTSGPQSNMEKDRPVTTSSLWRSTDAGRTWHLVRADSPAEQLTALAVDPGASGVLYGLFNTGQGPVLSVSRDRGATWAREAGLPSDAGRTYGADRAIYFAKQSLSVAGLSSVAVRQVGAWTRRSGPAGARAFMDIAGGFSGGTLVLYGITRNALYVSEDGGQSWSQSSLPGV